MTSPIGDRSAGFCYSPAMSDRVIRVAVATPLRALFDYRVPYDSPVAAGMRVRVPFGRARAVGVVVALDVASDCAADKIRRIEQLLDPLPLLDEDLLSLLRWVADYYHHPVGEVIAAALPVRLRRPIEAMSLAGPGWRLLPDGVTRLASPPARAPRQAEVLRLLGARPGYQASHAEIRCLLPNSAAVMRVMAQKGWLEKISIAPSADPVCDDTAALALNPQQRSAMAAVAGDSDRFCVSLLDGVTGSGKTEIYLQLAAQRLAAGRSVLVLVPEISLTPQLLRRFQRRLGDTVRVLHSGLGETEREQTWHRLRLGLSGVLLGTRSAIFTPLPNLGLVIVDEEHDPSYKQTEGFRYSARDLAVVRAQRAGCPVLLGSATPSLESLRSARLGRYRHLKLDQRAGEAASPAVGLLDIRDQPLQCGLSHPLLERVGHALGNGEQVILFLNRRGFAPVLSCFSCGWLSDCPRCDARQTVHRTSGLLWCHHCGAQRRVPQACPECGVDDLHPLGQGTERLEGYLAERFPDVPLVRVDRDSVARKGSLDVLLDRLREPGPALLVGTQMLAKGHHFPAVTLVGVVDADSGLFSADFRASERLAQLLVQVAGRAGRGERPGRVLIQTRHPDHPLLRTLVGQDYRAFARQALAEREAAMMPPFSYQALLRVDAREMARAVGFLDALVGGLGAVAAAGVEVWGPVPAPMARRAGRHRAHLLFQAAVRSKLHALLHHVTGCIADLPDAGRVRWSLDVDPLDLY